MNKNCSQYCTWIASLWMKCQSLKWIPTQRDILWHGQADLSREGGSLSKEVEVSEGKSQGHSLVHFNDDSFFLFICTCILGQLNVSCFLKNINCWVKQFWKLFLSTKRNNVTKNYWKLSLQILYQPVPRSPLAENLTPSFVQQMTMDSPIWLKSLQILWNSWEGILTTQLYSVSCKIDEKFLMDTTFRQNIGSFDKIFSAFLQSDFISSQQYKALKHLHWCNFLLN